jgi:hypothetical protein
MKPKGDAHKYSESAPIGAIRLSQTSPSNPSHHLISINISLPADWHDHALRRRQDAGRDAGKIWARAEGRDISVVGFCRQGFARTKLFPG